MSRRKIRIRKNTDRNPNSSPNRVAVVNKPRTPQTNPLPIGCFLTTEEEPQFRILLGEYIATYNPQHRDEYDLLTEAVYCKWRQQRYWLAETGQIEIAIARNEANLQKELPRADRAAHLANGIAHSEDLIHLYLRQNNQLHRQYLRCLKELRDLQSLRLPPDSRPNEPIDCPTNIDRQEGDPTSPDAQHKEEPNEAIEPCNPTQAQGAPQVLTPEQARLEYMKAEIQRFEAYQARLLGKTQQK